MISFILIFFVILVANVSFDCNVKKGGVFLSVFEYITKAKIKKPLRYFEGLNDQYFNKL